MEEENEGNTKGEKGTKEKKIKKEKVLEKAKEKEKVKVKKVKRIIKVGKENINPGGPEEEHDNGLDRSEDKEELEKRIMAKENRKRKEKAEVVVIKFAT